MREKSYYWPRQNHQIRSQTAWATAYRCLCRYVLKDQRSSHSLLSRRNECYSRWTNQQAHVRVKWKRGKIYIETMIATSHEPSHLSGKERKKENTVGAFRLSPAGTNQRTLKSSQPIACSCLHFRLYFYRQRTSNATIFLHSFLHAHLQFY
jgi:hypothetical protein